MEGRGGDDWLRHFQLLRRAEDLDPRQQQLLASLRGHCAQLDRLAEHVTGFAKMMTKRTGHLELAGWLERVEADDQPELHTFAAGIRQDRAAVTAGLTLPYSSGTTEGNVNRLKAIKRQMYGRATGPPAQTRHPSPTVTSITEFAPEPRILCQPLLPWARPTPWGRMDAHGNRGRCVGATGG